MDTEEGKTESEQSSVGDHCSSAEETKTVNIESSDPGVADIAGTDSLNNTPDNPDTVDSEVIVTGLEIPHSLSKLDDNNVSGSKKDVSDIACCTADTDTEWNNDNTKEGGLDRSTESLLNESSEATDRCSEGDNSDQTSVSSPEADESGQMSDTSMKADKIAPECQISISPQSQQTDTTAIEHHESINTGFQYNSTIPYEHGISDASTTPMYPAPPYYPTQSCSGIGTSSTERYISQTIGSQEPGEIKNSTCMLPNSAHAQYSYTTNSVKSESSGLAPQTVPTSTWNSYNMVPNTINSSSTDYSVYSQIADFNRHYDSAGNQTYTDTGRTTIDPMLPRPSELEEGGTYDPQQHHQQQQQYLAAYTAQSYPTVTSADIAQGQSQATSPTSEEPPSQAYVNKKPKKVVVPADPCKWSMTNVKDWLDWTVREYNFYDVIDVEKFPDVNGRELCTMSPEDFIRHTGNYQAAEKLLDHLAMLRESYRAGLNSSPTTPTGSGPGFSSSDGSCIAKSVHATEEPNSE